jgi:small nuclear ribonucleoprotein (snRNP)-like protein
MKQALKKYLKKKIVIDTRSTWVYIGILDEILDNCIVLSEADVHDSNAVQTTKEFYVLESKKTGIKSNRHKVYINMEFIVSFSSLDEVKHF